VCVPGCGAGHDVRALAAQGADVIGLDLAPSALQLAASFQNVNGERYREVDFFQAPVELEAQFDWIFEHTCFCAIDPERREEYVQSCLKLLKPGGHLLAVFFMTPDADEGPPFGTSQKELEHLFSSDFQRISQQVPQCSYSGREGREILCRLKRR
jgi:SAM-dependent methyltransferase